MFIWVFTCEEVGYALTAEGPAPLPGSLLPLCLSRLGACGHGPDCETAVDCPTWLPRSGRENHASQMLANPGTSLTLNITLSCRLVKA